MKYISVNTLYGLVSWQDILDKKFFVHSFLLTAFLLLLFSVNEFEFVALPSQSVNQDVDFNSLVQIQAPYPEVLLQVKLNKDILGQFTLPVWTQGPCMPWTIIPQPHPSEKSPGKTTECSSASGGVPECDTSETAGDTSEPSHLFPACSFPSCCTHQPHTEIPLS